MAKSPIKIDLRDDEENANWLQQARAARLKGAPLTDAERKRVIAGKPWDGAQGSGD